MRASRFLADVSTPTTEHAIVTNVMPLGSRPHRRTRPSALHLKQGRIDDVRGPGARDAVPEATVALTSSAAALNY
jgi:hypothetical protein